MNWEDARTLKDLGEMTVRWLLGEIDATPSHGGPPDRETARIVDYLVAFNRVGFVTENSQPAENVQYDNDGHPLYGQRAMVSGWCDRSTAQRLVRLTLASDLIVLAHQPGGDSCVKIPVTIAPGGPSDGSDDSYAIWDEPEDVGGAFTFAGSVYGDEDIDDIFSGECSPEAVTALQTAWTVEIIDPMWGRDDVLWPALAQVLEAA